jgi:hypothetical protein
MPRRSALHNVIMMYCTRSQIFTECIAGAEAGLPTTRLGVQQYLDAGVAPSKLILGVPWFGTDYVCRNGTAPDARFCPIKEVPFMGVKCQGTTGHQIPYGLLADRVTAAIKHGARRGDIYNVTNVSACSLTTEGMMWDDDVSVPWYNYRDTDGTIHQRWLDDPRSPVEVRHSQGIWAARCGSVQVRKHLLLTLLVCCLLPHIFASGCRCIRTICTTAQSSQICGRQSNPS